MLLTDIWIIILSQEIQNLNSCALIIGNPEETMAFREMNIRNTDVQLIKDLADKKSYDWLDILCIYMLDSSFQNDDSYLKQLSNEFVKKRLFLYRKRDETAFSAMKDSYKSVLADIQYFPIPYSMAETDDRITYENSWMFERTFGGPRGHEGTDLFPKENTPDLYPVISMTDGVIEKIGWLKKGGYRIGIRSPSGGYFYYAHLSSYYKEFKEGDSIKAGELLGYMGDTGYGEEGTSGLFDVHLHLGIYIQTEHYRELSVNPYHILKCTEDLRIGYNF